MTLSDNSLSGSSKMFQHKLLSVVSVQSILNAGNKLISLHLTWA